MPFSTDMNWPQGLLNVFNSARNQGGPLEFRYSGPYDRLFNYALIEGSFTVFLAPGENFSCDAVDLDVFTVASGQGREPVLIMDIRDDKWANRADNRREADAQMRKRFDQMLVHSALPCLYGLSLLGTSLRVYCGDKATGRVTPELVGHPDEDPILPCDFLEGLWELDILSLDGFKKVQEVVAYIEAEATKL